MIRGFFERGSKKFEQPHRMRKSISRKHCLKFGVEVREPFHLVWTYRVIQNLAIPSRAKTWRILAKPALDPHSISKSK